MDDLMPFLNQLYEQLMTLPVTFDQRLAIIVTAIVAGLTMRSITSRISLAPAPQRALADYLAEPEGEPGQPIDWTNREAVILLSLGLPAREDLLSWIRLGSALGPALLLLLIGFPWVVALGGGALCYVLGESFLNSRWHKLRVEIEGELPTFVSRLAGTLLVTASPLKALTEVAGTLNDDSSLKQWLNRLMSGTRLEGYGFFEQARNEASHISPSLALVVFQLSRFFETGGAGFAKAFTTTAEELSAILEARAVAGAKAESARGAVLMMLTIMGGILLLMLSSPNIRQGFDEPVVQMISAVALAAMGGGYLFLNGMIDDAMEG